MAKSLEAPLKQIAENAGMEGGVVVEKVKNLTGNEGLNAATGVYEDLVKIGVIDAAKVTRSALQNAASIAALFLTTEAVVADKPEEAGHGGGMAAEAWRTSEIRTSPSRHGSGHVPSDRRFDDTGLGATCARAPSPRDGLRVELRRSDRLERVDAAEAARGPVAATVSRRRRRG